MKRLFIAFKLSLDTEYMNMTAAMKMRTTFDSMTWVEGDLHHCTIRFLGKTPEFQIVAIKNLMDEVCADVQPFDLTISKLGIFGSRYAPKVLWMGFDAQPLLETLYSNLEKRLIENGFPKNEGNFVPHLTLARIRKIRDKRLFSNMISEMQPAYRQTVRVSELILFQSKLEKEGPIYLELAKSKLKG